MEKMPRFEIASESFCGVSTGWPSTATIRSAPPSPTPALSPAFCAGLCGATAITLIPTRAGNGAMEELANGGEFSPPSLKTLEESFEYGRSLQRGRVFVDLWDVQSDSPERVERLRAMSLSQ